MVKTTTLSSLSNKYSKNLDSPLCCFITRDWVWWVRNTLLNGSHGDFFSYSSPFPSLPCPLLTFFSVRHPFPVVQKFTWAACAGNWSFIHLKFTWFFLQTKGTPTESQLGTLAPIVHSGPRQHPPAFSCCSATLKISYVDIQITKIIKLSLTEISNVVLCLFYFCGSNIAQNMSFLLLMSLLKENVKLIHV